MAPPTSDMPPDLLAVQRFVNSHGGITGSDHLADTRSAAVWLTGTGVMIDAVDETTLARLRSLREALRLTMLAHNGLADDEEAAAALTPLCQSSNLALVVGRGATPVVTGAGSGVDGLCNALLAAVAVAAIDGSWNRVKACAEDDCRRAFWDATRNGSQRFCTSAGCANRARQRAYRARHRSGTALRS